MFCRGCGRALKSEHHKLKLAQPTRHAARVGMAENITVMYRYCFWRIIVGTSGSEKA
jgi:hypothetical protein